jgi:DNA-binding NarL/FixJ family response regulator
MEIIQVVVFDDNANRRNSLQLLINSTDGMNCSGIFPDCREVVNNISKCKPDVVLMDIDMPNVNGIEGLKLIREHFPSIRILMQTVFDDDEKIFAAIYAGADGYLLKKAHPIKLIEGILEVMQGGAPMTPSVARQVLNLFNGKHRKKSSTDFNLSERETEILSLLVKGMSYKKIADTCNISTSTVNSHIQKIYEKLHVHSATEAVSKALGENLI